MLWNLFLSVHSERNQFRASHPWHFISYAWVHRSQRHGLYVCLCWSCATLQHSVLPISGREVICTSIPVACIKTKCLPATAEAFVTCASMGLCISAHTLYISHITPSDIVACQIDTLPQYIWSRDVQCSHHNSIEFIADITVFPNLSSHYMCCEFYELTFCTHLRPEGEEVEY